jgi:hypothetical protein
MSRAFYYDPEANDWAQVQVKGPKPPFGIDMSACLDPKRKRVYLGGGSYPTVERGANALWIYDFQTDAFVDPKPKGAPCAGDNQWSTNLALLHYDSANDVVVLIRHKGEADEQGVFIYDPDANEWTTALAGKDFPWARRAANRPPGKCAQRSGFYHPGLNVHYVFGATDGHADGEMFVYRYKRPTTPETDRHKE